MKTTNLLINKKFITKCPSYRGPRKRNFSKTTEITFSLDTCIEALAPKAKCMTSNLKLRKEKLLGKVKGKITEHKEKIKP